MEEMRQSVRIMKQCLEKLRLPEGQGPVGIKDNKIVPPQAVCSMASSTNV
jgi:NADH-quinone oxidoreductase subunit D